MWAHLAEASASGIAPSVTVAHSGNRRRQSSRAREVGLDLALLPSCLILIIVTNSIRTGPLVFVIGNAGPLVHIIGIGRFVLLFGLGHDGRNERYALEVNDVFWCRCAWGECNEDRGRHEGRDGGAVIDIRIGPEVF